MAGNVLIIAEQRKGQFRKAAYEVATAGRKVADDLGGDVTALVFGKDVSGMATELGAYGVDKVLVAENDLFDNYTPEGFVKVILETIAQLDPEVVLFGATSQGKDLAPRVASKLGVGLASDCTGLQVDGGKLIAKRPVYAGKAFIQLAFKANPQMASLRPKAFTAEVKEEGKTAPVEKVSVSVDASELKTKVKEFQETGGGKVELTEADIIVSGGRGMKGPENFKMLEELADLLGGAVGASRAAVDAGWRPHSDQVGQTGKTVSPNLYIAVGISGAIQHLAGMGSSKVIVAINKDPEAPIFQKADYGVVADLFDVVPKLIEEVKKLKN